MELALSQAQADWLKNEEEIRQREIDQAVEVAITNAVAEAKVEWEKEIMAQVSSMTCSSRPAGFEKWSNRSRKLSLFLKKVREFASTVSRSRVLTSISEHSRELTSVL